MRFADMLLNGHPAQGHLLANVSFVSGSLSEFAPKCGLPCHRLSLNPQPQVARQVGVMGKRQKPKSLIGSAVYTLHNHYTVTIPSLYSHYTVTIELVCGHYTFRIQLVCGHYTVTIHLVYS